MTKNEKNLSARERKEKQEMRRWLLIGGSAFAAVAAAGVGSTFMDPSFPTLDGDGSIGARIEGAGMGPDVLELTRGTSGPDVLIIGSTGCSFCRKFIEDGLDDFVEFAKKNGLGVSYAGVGNSLDSLASLRLLRGYAQHSKSDAVTILKSVYAAAEEIAFGGKIEVVAEKYGKTLGVFPSELRGVLDESALEVTTRMQTTLRAFPVAGTPMFFVANEADASRISTFNGWAGQGGLQRQIKAARSA